MQKLRSAKRFNQSRLDFLPELGYVYICYSILKPSNYVLSCTPSHINLPCVTAPMATSTPHKPIITPTSWLTLIFCISNSRCLSVADNLASCILMAEILTFIIGLTYLHWLKAKIYFNNILRWFFCDFQSVICVLLAWFSCNLVWHSGLRCFNPANFSSCITFYCPSQAGCLVNNLALTVFLCDEQAYLICSLILLSAQFVSTFESFNHRPLLMHDWWSHL